MTPSKWSYWAWAVIYAWQFIWLVYGLSTICREGVDSYLYCYPAYFPTSIYVVFTLNNILNMLWMFLFDRKELIPSLVAAAFVAFSAMCALGLSLRGTNKYGGLLYMYGKHKEVWLARFSVQNGLALYAAYSAITTLINLAVVMVDWEESWIKFLPGYPNTSWSEDAVTICLGIMALELVLWTAMDLTILADYTCYIFTPYLAFAWAAVAILEENYADGSRNSLLTIGILGAVLLAIVVKFTFMIWDFAVQFNREAPVGGDQQPRSKPPSLTNGHKVRRSTKQINVDRPRKSIALARVPSSRVQQPAYLVGSRGYY